MIARPELAAIAFRGRDAAAFLQNQLTQDVASLPAGGSTFAALCQPKGRAIALLLVGAAGDGLRVICHRSLAEGLVRHLRRFVFRDDVVIESLPEATVCSGDGEAVTDAGAFEPLPGHRYVLAGAPAPAADAGPAEAARAGELAAGIAWLDETTSEQFLPQMLGHETIGALSFGKGCFPGQEVIARTRYLGKLKRFPWTGTVEAPLPLEALGEAELHGQGQTATAVLVDQAQAADGTATALLVARRPEAFDVQTIAVGERRFAVRGRWLEPPPRG